MKHEIRELLSNSRCRDMNLHCDEIVLFWRQIINYYFVKYQTV